METSERYITMIAFIVTVSGYLLGTDGREQLKELKYNEGSTYK